MIRFIRAVIKGLWIVVKSEIQYKRAVRATWKMQLKGLPLQQAIERKRHEITAAMIRDEELCSLFVPEWLIGKEHKKDQEKEDRP